MYITQWPGYKKCNSSNMYSTYTQHTPTAYRLVSNLIFKLIRMSRKGEFLKRKPHLKIVFLTKNSAYTLLKLMMFPYFEGEKNITAELNKVT